MFLRVKPVGSERSILLNSRWIVRCDATSLKTTLIATAEPLASEAWSSTVEVHHSLESIEAALKRGNEYVEEAR
jgi:hypothetical protein